MIEHYFIGVVALNIEKNEENHMINCKVCQNNDVYLYFSILVITKQLYFQSIFAHSRVEVGTAKKCVWQQIYFNGFLV